MKKSTFFILFSLLSCLIKAQKEYHFPLMISYDMYLNYGGSEAFKAQLLYANDAAFFSYKPISDNNHVEMKDEESIEISFSIRDTATCIQWSDRNSNEVNEVVKVKREEKLIVEPLDAIAWEIGNETKTIETYSCYKATCSYRGRNYTVWFTPDIPCNWGPWKLHGLPGAILEAYDDKREVLFYATGVTKKDATITCPDKHYEKITREAYWAGLKQAASDLVHRLGSRFGEGMKVTIPKPKMRGIEIIE